MIPEEMRPRGQKGRGRKAAGRAARAGRDVLPDGVVRGTGTMMPPVTVMILWCACNPIDWTAQWQLRRKYLGPLAVFAIAAHASD